jgi:hypothetical protein
MLSLEKTPLEKLEGDLTEHLGRELTAREKFYLALSEACSSLPQQQPGDEQYRAAD